MRIIPSTQHFATPERNQTKQLSVHFHPTTFRAALTYVTLVGASCVGFFLFGALPEAVAQSAASITLQGAVVLPPTRSAPRRARGHAYRSRLSGTTTADLSHARDARNPFEDVIIAAFPLSFEASTEPLSPVEIRQNGATFSPHVTPVTVGTVVQFVNDDDFFHNVFSLTPGSKFNIGRRPKGETVERRIDHVTISGVGPIEIFCDIHAQMNATILSLDTPYFVRASTDGSYTLANLPPGRYRVQAFHPQHGIVDHEMELTSTDSAATWTFVFTN